MSAKKTKKDESEEEPSTDVETDGLPDQERLLVVYDPENDVRHLYPGQSEGEGDKLEPLTLQPEERETKEEVTERLPVDPTPVSLRSLLRPPSVTVRPLGTSKGEGFGVLPFWSDRPSWGCCRRLLLHLTGRAVGAPALGGRVTVDSVYR